ncbi:MULTISPECIES: sensor histidine kinase [Bacillales]|uniref:sensor histidine kinase n=1 Tax=Bacillales TaxID=1385 RepID=UPI0013773C30|nr:MULTISPECIES: ATP-binding protein [Bacillales]MDN4094602.1 ATP-binding protein [Brevibacillus agri]
MSGLTIGLTSWFVGVSIKEQACYLVNQFEAVSSDSKLSFNLTMHNYLIRVTLLIILISGMLLYLVVRKIFQPIKQLGLTARKLAHGEYVEPLPITSQDEVGQLIADFNLLTRKLKQGEELRAKMVGDIAHELRTPLTNIMGYLEALSSGILEGNQKLYHSLHEESLRISRLVEQLHQLNIWESKKTSLHAFAPFSIKNVVETTLNAFTLDFQNKDIQCNWDIVDINIYGYEDGIKQVMNNLLKNAVQYDMGGWIHVKGEVINEHYKVTVTNLGREIPLESQKLLFERFYRIDPSRSRETGGAGIGLAIVKEIIELHDGMVGLTTKGDRHSFWFSIPLKRSEE